MTDGEYMQVGANRCKYVQMGADSVSLHVLAGASERVQRAGKPVMTGRRGRARTCTYSGTLGRSATLSGRPPRGGV